MLSADTIFKYNNNLSKDENFRFWYSLNTIEREGYGEKKLEYAEALQVFENVYKFYVDKR